MTQLLAPQVAPSAPTDPVDGGGRAADDGGSATDAPGAHAPLSLIALVLGGAGVVLGVTIVWFFAAIPLGIASVISGLVARRRSESSHDPRAASRATIGMALGCVAILLGATGAIFLPRVLDRADRFLGTIQQDVNTDVGTVNHGLSHDVNRLDFTLTRNLNTFETQNRRDLTDLENRTAATLKALEDRMRGDVDASSVAAKRDLEALEASIRADLRAARTDVEKSDAALRDSVTALDLRITRIEAQLGLDH